jgi:hypothetical protein
MLGISFDDIRCTLEPLALFSHVKAKSCPMMFLQPPSPVISITATIPSLHLPGSSPGFEYHVRDQDTPRRFIRSRSPQHSPFHVAQIRTREFATNSNQHKYDSMQMQLTRRRTGCPTRRRLPVQAQRFDVQNYVLLLTRSLS